MRSFSSQLERATPERVVFAVLQAQAWLACGLLLLILAFLVWEAKPALEHVGLERFFRDPSWHPTPEAATGTFNMLPMVVGSLVASALAMVMASPLGVLAALFCSWYAPPSVASLFRRLLELLAGIPSVVFGFWGLVTLVPLIRAWQPPGPSLLAASLVLALMILPTIALTAEAAFQAVPRELAWAAAALGLSRWRTLFGVVLPAARSGLWAGHLLAVCRALGETLAVLLVCGNLIAMPTGLFAPFRPLTAHIALEMAYATGDHRAALFAAGLALMAVVALLVWIVDLVRRPRA